jgi:hypothetical protein
MVLSYVTYATAVFHLAWATRSPFFALALFFCVHVPLAWAVWGTGIVGAHEYFVLYPAVAAAAALLGFVYALRVNCGALVTWLAWRRACACVNVCACAEAVRTQWRSVARHAFFVALLVVAPALPLELYENAFVGGLVSLLVAVLAHILYWWATHADCALSCSGVARRTFSVWTAVLDVVLLRLASTLVYMLWPDFLYTLWPLYVILASIGVALGPALALLEWACRAPPCACAQCRGVVLRGAHAHAQQSATRVTVTREELLKVTLDV